MGPAVRMILTICVVHLSTLCDGYMPCFYTCSTDAALYETLCMYMLVHASCWCCFLCIICTWSYSTHCVWLFGTLGGCLVSWIMCCPVPVISLQGSVGGSCSRGQWVYCRVSGTTVVACLITRFTPEVKLRAGFMKRKYFLRISQYGIVYTLSTWGVAQVPRKCCAYTVNVLDT